MDTYDFNVSNGVLKAELAQLRELLWLEQNYNLILMGPKRHREDISCSRLGYMMHEHWVPRILSKYGGVDKYPKDEGYHCVLNECV